MIGESIPHAIYIFLGIYLIIVFIISIFIQRYIIRKGSSITLNIFCIFLWFAVLAMILVIPLDLFTDGEGTKTFSAVLYWLFYICGFIIVDQIRSYMINGNFTVLTKIISITKFMGIFMLFFVGIGFILKWILKLCVYLFGDNSPLSITINIISTIVNMPMLIAYLMFLGCGLWEVPRDLFIQFYYPIRIRKLCWEITHVMRKYKNETEFMSISINKIKLTQEKIKSLNIDTLKNQIKEAKEKMDSETDKEQKKEKKKIYDNLTGFKKLYKYEKEMNEMIKKLEKTIDFFNLNQVDNSEVEIKELKNLDELVDINEKYKMYKQQIFRLNYQKYSIYKEWAEIKSFLILKDSKKNVIENYKDKGSNFKNNLNNNKNMEPKNKDSNINLHVENNENIGNLETYLKFGINKRNKSNLDELSYEIRNIENKAQNFNEDNFEFQKLFLSKKTIIYYKIMPIISYILIVICIAYDVIIIFGQVEYTFKWDLFAGKVLRWLFTNIYIITPIRLFPFYFTFFVLSYSFGTIKSDMTFCVYTPQQTEPCHALFFIGMISKLICPLCFNYIEIMYNGIDLKGNGSKLAEYFEDQFGYLNDSDNIVIFIVKIVLLFLFLKAICCTATRCYGNFAYKKHKYLTFHSTYEEKESEILKGELILKKLNKIYGKNLKQLQIDNISEYEEEKK